MDQPSSSRRRALQQLVGLTALGAVNALRAPQALAQAQPARLAIPDVAGKVIQRADADYEIWRQSMVWHLSKPNRYPDVIVQARSTAEIGAAVRYAAQHRLKVTVRSGGHNVCGPALRDGGLLIDLSALSDIRIDASRRIASIEPGVRSFELIQAAHAQGLAFPVPHCPSVGMSGFAMGGGMGWNWPQFGGMAVHSIVGAEVVLADGQVRRVTATENPDLFWAVRGVGPGFFGVVTQLELQLYPAPKSIMASSYIFPLDDLAMVTATLDEILQSGKVDRVEPILVLMHHPEVPADAPPEKSKICFFTAFAFEDSEEQARQALQPFAQSALASRCLVKKEHQPFGYEGLYENYFSLNDPGGRCARYAVDNVLTHEPAKTLLAVAEHLRKAPTPYCHVLGAYNLRLRDPADACFSWDADTFIGCYALWDEERDDGRVLDWHRACLPLIDPFAAGHYVNEVDGRGNPDRYRQCFSTANWQRLERLRRQHDPAGVFHSYLGHT